MSSAFHYRFDLSCNRCGGAMAHTADGTTSGLSCQAVACCLDCGHRYVVRVVLLDAGPGPRPPAPTECFEPIGPLHPVIESIMRAEDETRRRKRKVAV